MYIYNKGYKCDLESFNAKDLATSFLDIYIKDTNVMVFNTTTIDFLPMGTRKILDILPNLKDGVLRPVVIKPVRNFDGEFISAKSLLID